VIFSRGRGSGGRHHKSEESRRSVRHEAGEPPELDDLDLPGDDGPSAGPVGDEVGGVDGPYDITEVDDDVHRLDLGSLKLPAIDGVEVRVQAGEDGGIQQVVLVHGDSALQLGVFAAPRSEGIWDEVRTEIRKSLFDDGVAAEDTPGEYGTELRARVRTPEGLADIRFVGIDGPRWMVRAVFQGQAAVDPAAAGPLVQALRGLVVERGQEAMPVREALPLRLPREIAEQAAAEQEAAAQQESGHSESGQPGGGAAGANGQIVLPAANGGAAPEPRRRPSPRPRRSA
jgi:hypothetical protein